MFEYLIIEGLFYRTRNGDWHKEAWAGRAHCPFCGKKSDFSIVYNTASARFLGIPYFTLTDDRYIQCDSCGDYQKLRVRDFRNIKKQQQQAMKNGNYPAEKILQHYAPQKLHMPGIITKFVLCLLFWFLFVWLLISTVTGGYFNGAYVVLCVLGAVPLIFSLFRFVPMVKKCLLYHKAKNNPDCFTTLDRAQAIDRTYLFVDAWNKRHELSEGVKDFEYYSSVSSGTGSCDDVYDDTPPGFGQKLWYTICAVLGIVPFGFLKKKELWPCCKSLFGTAHKKMGIVSAFAALVVLFTLSYSCFFKIADALGMTNAIPNNDVIFIGAMLSVICLGVGIPFTLINRVHTRRIIKCLYLVEQSGNLGYVGEILSHASSDRCDAFLGKHLVYDKPSYTLAAYTDITWVYQRTDNEGKVVNYIGLRNGKVYSTTLSTGVLSSMADKYVIMSGYTQENKAAFKKVAEAYKKARR